METNYFAELSKSSRSKCSLAKCKKIIEKGELRFGSAFEINSRRMVKYRHWNCLTPKIIKNIGSMDNMAICGEVDEENIKIIQKTFEIN